MLPIEQIFLDEMASTELESRPRSLSQGVLEYLALNFFSSNFLSRRLPTASSITEQDKEISFRSPLEVIRSSARSYPFLGARPFRQRCGLAIDADVEHVN